ncbi:MAG: amidohydrolase family protein [Chloroflexota bacterium]
MIAVRGGRLIDGSGAEPLEGAVVLIEAGKVTAVGRQGQVAVPPQAQVLDATGKTVMPGLIDAHVHIMMAEYDLQRTLTTPLSFTFYEAIQNMRATLEAGVTTVRDASGADLGVKLAVERGLILGPRLVISVGMLSQTGGHGDDYMPVGVEIPIYYPGKPVLICDGPVEARRAARRAIRAGADVIKIASSGGVLSPTTEPDVAQFRMDELRAIVEEAHAAKKRVMSHAQSTAGILNALQAGVESIEHGIYVDDACIELMLAQGSYLVPTLYAPHAVLEVAERTGRMPEWGLRKTRQVIQVHQQNVARAIAAGVKVVMGTDSGIDGHGQNARELTMLAEAGLSPMQVIVAATRLAAECLGLEDQIGTLESGKLADLLIVEGDPLADIKLLEDTSRIQVVMKAGQVVVDRRR